MSRKLQVFASPGVEAIAVERRRQIDVEGYAAECDDHHIGWELAQASAAYALNRKSLWPKNWCIKFFKISERRRDLVKAGALIAAEIDRLDRLAAAHRKVGV